MSGAKFRIMDNVGDEKNQAFVCHYAYARRGRRRPIAAIPLAFGPCNVVYPTAGRPVAPFRTAIRQTADKPHWPPVV